MHTPLGLTPPHPLAQHPPWSTPPGQTPPSLRYYGIQSTSGRYWNAYLFGLFLPENCMKLKKKVGSRKGTSLVPPLGPPLLKILTKNRISTTLHVYPSMHWDRHPPQQTPPGRHPPGQTPPGRQPPPPADTHPPGKHPTPMATAADGTHPTGMHSCYRQTFLFPWNRVLGGPWLISHLC